MSKYIGRQSRADIRESRTGMRQSMGGMVFKIVLGVLFIVVSFTFVATRQFAEMVVGWILGGLLIAWALIPYFKSRRILKGRADVIESLGKDYQASPLQQNSNKTFADEEIEKLAKRYEDPEIRL